MITLKQTRLEYVSFYCIKRENCVHFCNRRYGIDLGDFHYNLHNKYYPFYLLPLWRPFVLQYYPYFIYM